MDLTSKNLIKILTKLTKGSNSTFALILILIILVVSTFFFDFGNNPIDAKPDVKGQETHETLEGPFTVTDVVDGDTIKLMDQIDEFTVRYIGIDTPETVKPNTAVQCFGKEASNYNKSLVLNKQVYLEKDAGSKDSFGRELRYVYTKNGENFVMINKTLVLEGYAKALTVPPNIKYSNEFVELERNARENMKGLWAKCNN